MNKDGKSWRSVSDMNNYAEYDATVNILTLEVTGSLPKRAKALVLEWAEENRAALLENWTLCEKNQTPHKILPLP